MEAKIIAEASVERSKAAASAVADFWSLLIYQTWHKSKSIAKIFIGRSRTTFQPFSQFVRLSTLDFVLLLLMAESENAKFKRTNPRKRKDTVSPRIIQKELFFICVKTVLANVLHFLLQVRNYSAVAFSCEYYFHISPSHFSSSDEK